VAKEKIHDEDGRELALREFDPAEMCGDKPLSKRPTLAQEVLLLKTRVNELEARAKTHSRVIWAIVFGLLTYVALK
jgi:hypothetical protein